MDKKYWDKDKMYHCIVDNSNFTHSSDNNGRVIYSKYNVTVTNCKFENNNVSSLNDTAYNGVFTNQEALRTMGIMEQVEMPFPLN